MSNQQQTEENKCMVSDKEFDTDAMDNVLYKDGLDWTFEKPKDGAKYSIIYIIDKEDEKEEDKEQYKKICDAGGCYTILDIDTPIMCYMNKQNGDKTLCRVCYEDGDYQEDDENSDNDDSDDEEEEENKCWGNNKCERDEFGCCIVCCECKNCIKRIKEELEEEEEDSDDEEYVEYKVHLTPTDDDDVEDGGWDYMNCPKRITVKEEIIEWIEENECCSIDDIDYKEEEWCHVGEHRVSKDEMWKDFADCKNCVSEKEYKQQMED